jgi:hypothetical protein
MPEDLPVDILPASNEEYFPPPPTREQILMMQLADQETERWRRKMGMSRAEFVRTAAAMDIGFWAIDLIRPGIFGSYGALAHNTATTDACDLEWAGHKGLETLHNLPGEFVFDVQSHHVDPDGMWRVSNPAIEAFFAGVWPQSSPATGGKPSIGPGGYVRGGGAGEIDPIQNLSRSPPRRTRTTRCPSPKRPKRSTRSTTWPLPPSSRRPRRRRARPRPSLRRATRATAPRGTPIAITTTTITRPITGSRPANRLLQRHRRLQPGSTPGGRSCMRS